LGDKIREAPKSVLIYKRTRIESRILEEIVKQLNYDVRSVNDLEELLNMDFKDYNITLIDRVSSDKIHGRINSMIESSNIKSILFIDKDIEVSNRDRRIHSLIRYNFTNYKDVEVSLKKLISV